MPILVDTTVIIAVVTNEPHREQLLAMTANEELAAAPSLHWEIGNAFSSMFKRKRITVQQAIRAIDLYQQIQIGSVEVPLAQAVQLAADLDIYAYDAYVIAASLRVGYPLLTLDRGLARAAERAGVSVLEVTP